MNSTESAMTAGPSIQSTFKYMAPVNLCLASVVLLQNPVIIMDFYADRRKLSGLLFILIAAADMLTAGTELARGSVALTCVRDNDSKISGLFVLSYSLLSLFSYNCSIFFNLVLTIVKTIHLSNPFYRLQTGAIKTALVVVPLLILIVCAADAFSYWKLSSVLDGKCASQWFYVNAITSIGEGVVIYIAALVNVQNYVQNCFYLLLCIQYGLPSLVVLVCMCIQVYFIKKMAVLTLDTGDSVHRAHYTVLLVSLSFFVCTCAYTINVLAYDHGTTYYISPGMVAKYTLPLLNCVIFLLILVIRRRSIRQRNMECLQIARLHWGS